MIHSIASWLDQEELPDFYRLLGKPRLDPDVEGLEAAIHTASRVLLPYQNHADSAKAHRAMRLMLELGRAEDLLADRHRLAQFNEQLTVAMFNDCCAQLRKTGAHWDEESVRQCLESTCGVHPAASRRAAATLLAKSRNMRPVPVRVFGPTAADGSKATKQVPSDKNNDELLTPLDPALLPPDNNVPMHAAPELTPSPVVAPEWADHLSDIVPLTAPWPDATPLLAVDPSPMPDDPFDLDLHVKRDERWRTKNPLITAARLLLLAALIAWVPAIIFFAIHFAPHDTVDSGSKPRGLGHQSDNQDVSRRRRTSIGKNTTVKRPARGGTRP